MIVCLFVSLFVVFCWEGAEIFKGKDHILVLSLQINVGMCSDSYKIISFKVATVTDT